MNDNVISLVKPKVDPAFIEMLEEHLEEAKAGNIRALAVVTVTQDGRVGGDVNMGDCFASLLAAMVCTQHDLIEQTKID